MFLYCYAPAVAIPGTFSSHQKGLKEEQMRTGECWLQERGVNTEQVLTTGRTHPLLSDGDFNTCKVTGSSTMSYSQYISDK